MQAVLDRVVTEVAVLLARHHGEPLDTMVPIARILLASLQAEYRARGTPNGDCLAGFLTWVHWHEPLALAA